ncbi:MAG: hypothetical protein WCG09_01425 [Halobacteriota archaeon]
MIGLATVPAGKPLLSVKYAVLKQPLAPPEVTCPADAPFIKTVTLPPQTTGDPVDAVTSIAQFIDSPFVKLNCGGGEFKPTAAIKVAIFPDAEGVADADAEAEVVVFAIVAIVDAALDAACDALPAA